ncbi:hypothetical protein [Rhodococcus qingshengii]|uniref:hypothetical protein n=1 Tax=Rhodococcus qingshengii TaxID=334542 RepID=UPI0030D38DB0
MISADIDAYGGFARASCIADFVELLAIQGTPCSREEITDQIADLWGGKALSKLAEGDEPPSTIVEIAYTCLSERERILGDLYPFEIKGPRVKYKSPTKSEYVELLALTTCHAYTKDITISHSPTRIFEDILSVAIPELGFNAAAMGTASGGTFQDRLKGIASSLKLDVDLSGTVLPTHAQDLGVDLIGHHKFHNDNRPGRWFFLGQATCAKSDDWTKKLTDPKVGSWKSILIEPVVPQVFLCVPHHVEPMTMRMLLDATTSPSVVLDRLRIVPLMHRANITRTEFSDEISKLSFEQYAAF